MIRKKPTSAVGYRYCSPNIPMSAIRRFARQVADKFQPDKIILFGSYAYGQPHQESDVDLLVVMPAYDHTTKAIRITLAFEHPFPLDLIVRTPKEILQGLKDQDWFLIEIVSKGKVLYEKANGEMGPKSRGRSGRRKKPKSPPAPTP